MESQETDKLKNPADLKPSEALEKLIINEDTEHPPKITGTGFNNPAPREDSLIIKKDEDDQE